MDNKNSENIRGGGDDSVSTTTPQQPKGETDLFSFNAKALLPLVKQLKHISLLRIIVLCILFYGYIVLNNGMKLELVASSGGDVKHTETYVLIIQQYSSSMEPIQNE